MSSLTSLVPLQELRVGSFTVQVKERLAEGGFGFIDLVIDVHTKKELVLKRCNVDRIESMEIVKKEINILQRFAGPYMVELLASDIIQKNKNSREALLLMEYYPGGHLLDRLNMRNGVLLPQESIYRMFGQVLLCVKSMHLNKPPIVHRDLKLENILFGSDGKIRLCDFGSCVEGYIQLRNMEERQAAEDIIAKETTQMYRAPELVDLYMRDVLTEKSDIWALGCILYALCFLTHPFQNAGSLGILSAKIQFPKVSPVSQDCHTLILRMLDVDPEARPDISQILPAVVALSKGKPLPLYELSQEAERRRRDRLEANELRLKKAAAKKGPPIANAAATPKAVPISSNSVAAKRLAALRGGPVPEGCTSSSSCSSSSQLLDEFDPFASSGTVSVDDFQPSESSSDHNDFTFSGSSQTQASSFPAFDAFGLEGGADLVTTTPPAPTSTPSMVVGQDTDWLDALPSQTPPVRGVTITASNPADIDIFDFVPSLPPTKEVRSDRDMAHSFDLLEIVNNDQPLLFDEDSFVASSAASPVKNVSTKPAKDSSTLDLLDLDIAIPAANTSSSSFPTAAATATKNKHDRVLSLFDVDHQAPAPPPTPVSSQFQPQSFASLEPYFSPPGTPNTRDARPMRSFESDYRSAMPPPRPNLPMVSPAMKLTLDSAAAAAAAAAAVNNSYVGVGSTPMRGYPSVSTASPSLRPQQPPIPMSGSRPVVGGGTTANFHFSSANTKNDPFDNLNLFSAKF